MILFSSYARILRVHLCRKVYCDESLNLFTPTLMKRTLLLTLALVFVFTGCGKKSTDAEVKANRLLVIPEQKFVQNPSVEKYRSIKNCEGLPDMQDCYANHAVWENDPSLCAKMEPGLDTLCLQYFYMQRNDPQSCNILPNKGIRGTCNEYYKDGKKK